MQKGNAATGFGLSLGGDSLRSIVLLQDATAAGQHDWSELSV
jgi:hypothetical protein